MNEKIFNWVKGRQKDEIEYAKRRIKRAIFEYAEGLKNILENRPDDDYSYYFLVFDLEREIEESYHLDEIIHDNNGIEVRKTTEHFIITAYADISGNNIEFEIEPTDELIFIVELVNEILKGKIDVFGDEK